MGDILIILCALVAVFVLIVIGVYNHFDRQRFILERMLRSSRAPLERWVSICESLQGTDSGFRKAKRLSDKTECLRSLIAQTGQRSEEQLDLQEELLEFCSSFNTLADRYDRELSSTLRGRLAGHLGFRPLGHIDFYPDLPY